MPSDSRKKQMEEKGGREGGREGGRGTYSLPIVFGQLENTCLIDRMLSPFKWRTSNLCHPAVSRQGQFWLRWRFFFFFFFFSLWESARWFGHKCSAITEQWGVRSDEMKWHEWEAPCQGLPQCSGGWSLLSPTPLNVVQHLHLAQWMCVCVCVCVCMCVWRLLIMDAATLEHYSLMGDVNKPLVHYILGWGSCWPWLKDKICLLSSLDMSYFWWMLPFQNPARWNICCCFEMMHVAVSFCTEVINTRNGITPPPLLFPLNLGLKQHIFFTFLPNVMREALMTQTELRFIPTASSDSPSPSASDGSRATLTHC